MGYKVPFPDSIKVSAEDAWVMLLSTVRYSLGRQTYMSQLAGELVIKYAPILQTGQISQIRDEVKKELLLAEDHYKTVGGKMDHDAWWRFVNQASDILKQRGVA